jgi:hypothetical protein
MTDVVRVNDRAYSWSSVLWKAFGSPWTGLLSIEFDDSLEVTKGYGLGRHHAPTRRSAGKYVPGMVKIKVFASTAQAMIDQAAMMSPSQRAYGQASFPMLLQLIEPGEIMPITTSFKGARIVKAGSSYQEGPDLLVQDMELDVMAILRNGKTLYEPARGVL